MHVWCVGCHFFPRMTVCARVNTSATFGLQPNVFLSIPLIISRKVILMAYCIALAYTGFSGICWNSEKRSKVKNLQNTPWLGHNVLLISHSTWNVRHFQRLRRVSKDFGWSEITRNPIEDERQPGSEIYRLTLIWYYSYGMEAMKKTTKDGGRWMRFGWMNKLTGDDNFSTYERQLQREYPINLVTFQTNTQSLRSTTCHL